MTFLKRSILIARLFICFNSYANLSCAIDNSCDEDTSKHVAQLLEWDEVLQYFDGFRFSTKPIRSEVFESAYISSFSNGSLTALLLLAKVKGKFEVVSFIDVPNHKSFELCDLNGDMNEDICLMAYPSGTNVNQYFAQYVQDNGTLKRKP